MFTLFQMVFIVILTVLFTSAVWYVICLWDKNRKADCESPTEPLPLPELMKLGDKQIYIIVGNTHKTNFKYRVLSWEYKDQRNILIMESISGYSLEIGGVVDYLVKVATMDDLN